MKWLEMANLLFEKSNALSPRGAHLHLDTAAWLRTWTPHQNQAADYGARYFARHQEWPPLEQESASQLYFRCLFAIETCIQNDASRVAQPKNTDLEQSCLESLLIDLWYQQGLDWAEKRYSTGKRSRLQPA